MDIDEAPATARDLALNVLETVNDARDMHGLRHDDYKEYRQFCSTKIARLRKSAGLTQAAPKKGFLPIPLTSEHIKTTKELEILLFDVERCWSHCMELKPDSDDSRVQIHLLHRLKRAVQAAERLLAVTQECCNERSKLEGQAYMTLMQASLALEQEKWENAWNSYAISRTLYLHLAKSGDMKQATMAQAAADNMDGSIRFCAYRLQVPDAQKSSIDDLVASRDGVPGVDLKALLRKSEAAVPSSNRETTGSLAIKWQGKKLSVKNQALYAQLLAIADESCQFAKYKPQPGAKLPPLVTKAEKYLAKANQAVDLAAKDVEEDRRVTERAISSKSAENAANVAAVHAYAQFKRMQGITYKAALGVDHVKAKRAGVVGTKRKAVRPGEVLNFIDASRTAINTVQALPVIQADPALLQYLNSQDALLAAHRTFFLACELASSERDQCMVLFDRAHEHVSHARVQADAALREQWIAEDESLAARELRDLASDFLQEVRLAKLREQARWALDKTGPDAEAEDKLPLVARLDTFVASFDPANPNLVAIPPKLIPVAPKPVFYDIANNGIVFPTRNVERRIAGQPRKPRAEAESGPAKAGLLGNVFGGLWRK
ncbi:signal recognition particle subunit srp68 [Geranomyces variabilis]|uniref:Signal recognition particle subunit SRP68 n=1 Tax=Geranomyces variabilis TaxID=109894 RepID=A0AAD5THS5_9FUNG|nr:signal recognition particle subunit srp68 [Geranomyces variabilis]